MEFRSEALKTQINFPLTGTRKGLCQDLEWKLIGKEEVQEVLEVHAASNR